MTRAQREAAEPSGVTGQPASTGVPGQRTRTAGLAAPASTAAHTDGLSDPLPPWTGPSLAGAGDPFGLHLEGGADRGAQAAPAVQRRARGSAPVAGDTPPGDPAAEPSLDLAPDRDHDRLAGTMSFLVRRAWLEADPDRRPAAAGFVTPNRTRELLDELVHAGLLAWAKPERLAAAAERLVLLDGTKGQAVVRVSLGAGAYNILGLPPGTGAMVSRREGGLELTVAAEGLDADGVRVELDPTQLDSAFDAVERFTQLTIPAARRRGVVVTASGGVGTFRIFLSQDNLGDLVGVEAWRAFAEREGRHDGARGASGQGAAVNSDLTDLELERARQWLRTHLPASKDEGVRIDRALLELLLRIDRSPHRAAILAVLARSEGGAAVTVLTVESLVNEAVFEAERAAIGVTAPKPTANLDPVHHTALPARIIQHASKIAAGDTVPFSVEVEWPPVLIDRAQGDEYRYRQFVTEVDWVFEKQPTGEKSLAHQRYTGGHATHDHVFRLAPDEPQATWMAHAFVRHSHFEPVHVQRPVVVQTEAVLMQELRGDAAAGMGSLHQDKEPKDFDTGLLNNRAGSATQDKGLSFFGQLPPGFTAATDVQRDQRRTEEMNQVRTMIAYMRGRDVDNTTAIQAAERYLANLERSDRAIEADQAAGWQTFEVRGTLRSKRPGVDDGALTLHGSLRRRDDGFIAVQLRDLSRRFGAEDLRTDGDGSDFAEALEEAFVPLCKAYPPGRLFILAQDHVGTKAMQTTIGFELDTGTVGEDIKAKVWDPAVKIAVNVAGLVAALAGFGAIAIPALAVYNGIETVDQLHEQYVNGTLTATDVELGLASLALDLLPAAGRVKVVGGSARAMFMLSLVDKAGEALYMTATAYHQIRVLEEQQIAHLVDQWERMVELQATTDAADPAMRAMQRDFDRQSEEVGHTWSKVVLELVGTRGVFVAGKHMAVAVIGPGGVGRPRWEELRDDGVFVARPDGEPYYDPGTGQIVGNPRTLDDAKLSVLEAQQANHMRLLATQLAEDLRVPVTDVEVMVGRSVVVQVGKSGGVTATYQPGVPPAKARASWREKYQAVQAGRATSAADAADPPREHLPPGEPGASRPRQNVEAPHGQVHVDADGTALPTPHRHLEKHELAASTELAFSVRQLWPEIEALQTSGHGVPIGRVLTTADEGHQAFQRIVRGDAGAVADLGVTGLPKDFDPLQQEWSLIETSDGFVVLAGDYGSVGAQGNVRALGHVHPAPRKGAPDSPTGTRDLGRDLNGRSYDEILANPIEAQASGLTPSPEDIQAITDGGTHVLYTRYASTGQGIANPGTADPRARVEVHMSGAKVRRWNPTTLQYIYEVEVRVKDTTGEPLWTGQMYADWNARDGKGKVHFHEPDDLRAPLADGWVEP